MNHSNCEKIAFFEFNKLVFHSITEGSLSDDFLNSKMYLTSQRFLLILINILEPIPYKDIKELALMVYKHFVFIKVKNVNLNNEIINTWDKYRETFLIKFKARAGEIIEKRYIEYGLDETTFKIENLTVPLKSKAFIEMYQVFDPLGFPICYKEYISAFKKIKRDLQDSDHPEAPGKEHLLSIPTKATQEQILNFWLELQGNNKKGEPFWESEEEIDHFVNQNFEGFEGVDEIKEFNPNMNKTELRRVTYKFFNKYGIYGTKPQYVKLLQENFTKFEGDKENSTYKNIANR